MPRSGEKFLMHRNDLLKTWMPGLSDMSEWAPPQIILRCFSFDEQNLELNLN